MENLFNKTAPFIIGLTGAIGTGKSLVRKMLEHKGALTIDADQLAHGAYASGTQGFAKLVRIFGNEILDQSGQVNRKRLGEIVFSNSSALHQLEMLIHPLVTQAVKRIIQLSPLPIIVVEAIKLLDSDLKKHCNVIWEVSAHPEEIHKRLSKTRGMSQAQITERLSHQNFEKKDRSLIDLTILNEGDINTLWTNLSAFWDELAKNSDSFRPAIDQTNKLLLPFHDYLIQKNSPLEVEAIEAVNQKGLVFLPVRNLDLHNKYFRGENSDFFQVNKNIFLYSLWRSAGKGKMVQFYLLDIENFSASTSVSLHQFDPKDFVQSLSYIQEFLSLHLCERLYFPFNYINESYGKEMGFKQIDDITISGIELSPLGYNLLYKQLRSPLALFRE